jgi:hypothetical protein
MALKWLKSAARQGYPDAQLMLFALYASGQGTTARPELAIYWLRAAAESDLPEAQYRLGELYASGTDLAQDWGKARLWFERAARQGNAEAEFSLGHIYRRGDYVLRDGLDPAPRRDGLEAVRQYKSAADRGHGAAALSLALTYDAGEAGVPQDKAMAVAWYEKAAEKGIAQACGNLAAMYLNGEGVPRDTVAGLVWMILAASAAEKNGDPSQAMYTQQRDQVLERLPRDQVEQLQQIASSWAATHW